jgi:hypothetical protein
VSKSQDHLTRSVRGPTYALPVRERPILPFPITLARPAYRNHLFE